MLRKILVSVALLTAVAAHSNGQTTEVVVCKSLVNPDNVRVFEGEHCPFGWTETDKESN